MTRWFLDTEFNEDGRTIDLISIAIVSESGEQHYWVSSEFDESRCNEWVREHVLPQLPPPASRRNRLTIARELKAAVLGPEGSESLGKPEFWGYFSDYDWVALCQLYGPMIELPSGFPMYCNDLKQMMRYLGVSTSELPKQEQVEHDALQDALWNLEVWRHLLLAEQSLVTRLKKL